MEWLPYESANENAILEQTRIMAAHNLRIHNDKIEDANHRIAQDAYIRTLYDKMDPHDKRRTYHHYLKDRLKQSKKSDTQTVNRPTIYQDHEGADMPIVNIQDYIIRNHLNETYDVYLNLNQCKWIRDYGKIQEFDEALYDAKRSAKWHRNLRPESNYKGHWYIEINDVKVDPPLERCEKDMYGELTYSPEPPMDIEPVITRDTERIPMGNCSECYTTGKVAEMCKHCEEGMCYTFRFIDEKRKIRVRDYNNIVDPRELARAVNKPILIPVYKQREIINPCQWEDVMDHYLGDFIHSQLIVGELQFISEDELEDIAFAVRFDPEAFTRKYMRRVQRYQDQGYYSDSDTTADEDDIRDKNQIG